MFKKLAALLCLAAASASFLIPTVATADPLSQANAYIQAQTQAWVAVKSDMTALGVLLKSPAQAKCVKTELKLLPPKNRADVAFTGALTVVFLDAFILEARTLAPYGVQLQAVPSSDAILASGAAAVNDEGVILQPLAKANMLTLCQYFKFAVRAKGNNKVLAKLLSNYLYQLKPIQTQAAFKARLAADATAIKAAGQEMLKLGVAANIESKWVKASTFSTTLSS
jgi:hypothetical protein